MATTKHLEKQLSRRGTLADTDRDVLRSLPATQSLYGHGEQIVAEGAAPRGSCLLVKGMAMRVHSIGRTERVVSALHVAGDFVDLHAFLLQHLDHDIVAVGECAVEFIDASHLTAITNDHPHLTRLLWLETLVDAKIHRVWVAARSALLGHQRVGHLMCELHARLQAVDLVTNNGFHLPLDQRGLAEVLGYSVVHINRAVQELRSAGVLEWEGSYVRLPAPEALAQFASFDPAYLELCSAER